MQASAPKERVPHTSFFLKGGIFGLKKAKSRGTTIHGDLYDLSASQARKREVRRTFEGPCMEDLDPEYYLLLVTLLPSIILFLLF